MNDEQLKIYCREHAGEALTAEAEALLQRDPELKREVDQLIVIQKLMSLKRHEQPAIGSAERCARAVSERIARDRQASFAERLRAWFTYESPVPGYVYAAAAVVVAVGLTLTLQQPGSTPAVAVMAPPEPVIEQVTFVAEALAETNEASVMTASTPAPEKPIIMLRVNADELIDTPRSGLTFGGDSSVPVSYER